MAEYTKAILFDYIESSINVVLTLYATKSREWHKKTAPNHCHSYNLQKETGLTSKSEELEDKQCMTKFSEMG